ncbi:MAG: hypothetical protein CSB47_00570 [Proteobacteria bacterium]|nr:MAG: hypothetical protein CSB47_00570 [Pseudomonadota bacterium]
MIKSTQAGETEVLGLSPGNFSLREFAEHFHELAEVRLFQKADGKLFLEAYLGKIRIGKFDARLVAELDAPEALLHSILKLGKDRKPTPNGYWQYNLNDQYLLDALEQRVWRFMYIPIADYEEKQIAFFGVPGLVEKVTDTAEYRYYPEKGLVVLWDKEGKETFYYSSPKEFERLKLAIEADKKPEAKQPKAEGMAGE